MGFAAFEHDSRWEAYCYTFLIGLWSSTTTTVGKRTATHFPMDLQGRVNFSRDEGVSDPPFRCKCAGEALRRLLFLRCFTTLVPRGRRMPHPLVDYVTPPSVCAYSSLILSQSILYDIHRFYSCAYGIVRASYANRATTCVHSRPIYP